MLRVRAMMTKKRRKTMMMAVLDHDGNGEIDYDEFVALLDAEPSQMAMHGDREFPKGAYVEVEGHGVGVYQGSTRSILGANEHTLQFKDGVKTLKLTLPHFMVPAASKIFPIHALPVKSSATEPLHLPAAGLAALNANKNASLGKA